MQKYSILMSVYGKDNPEYFKTAVDSILQQTVPPDQIVIVVDGPVPKAIDVIIEQYIENEKLFTILRHDKNCGLAASLNEGLENCRNELVARMDSDDISQPERCEKELHKFEKEPNLVICGCNIDEFYGQPDNVKTSRVVPTQYKDILRFARRRQPFNHPTVMYKKSKVLECGGYPLLKRKEDFDLFSRMLTAGCYAENIDESLYLYRANEDNYARRKSWTNTKSAIHVYTRHLKRKGCSAVDFLYVCMAEVAFFILPVGIMKKLSDNFLRKKV